MLFSIVEPAAAKLNLFLHITGKREDGYHLLESLVVFTRFGDTLEFFPADTVSLEITGEFADAVQQNNSVFKAAEALQAETGCSKGARIVLHKRIPVSAGLGGGSADAAATLRGLVRLWGLSLPPQTVHRLAASLGSDVPVCMAMQPAMMRGVGEQVTPIDLSTKVFVLLVNPRLPLATADVYRHYALPFDKPLSAVTIAEPFEGFIHDVASRRNALEKPAVQMQPVIATLLMTVRVLPGCRLARMAGSGATCFGLFETKDAATAAAEQLKRAHPDYWIETTELR